jgi:hypothetical protein
MSAYNWIEIFNDCPNCRLRTTIKCQTHYFSDYDGDDSGRFHDRTYKLGQKMPWWNELNQRYFSFLEGPRDFEKNQDGYFRECCYSTCLSCGAELYVVIEFKSSTPERVIDIGLESDWPQAYPK